MPSKKVLVIGLDCATPEFIFGTDAFELPNLRKLMDAGCWGRLESCTPPITVPAWSCMMSGKDPGTLGCYGFRNRTDRSYAPLRVSTSESIREPRLWDLLSEAGKKVVVLGVPQTYPPSPVNGCMVSGLLTPDTSGTYTYPPELKIELDTACGGYQVDVADFRTQDKNALLKRIHAFMHNRFDLADYLIDCKPWDFFMMVELGVDRLHHAFWSSADPAHIRHVPGNPYANAIRDYYHALDARIGKLLDRIDEDTAVLVVSDHGAKALEGGVCINQWLIDEGLLTLREMPTQPTRLEDCAIDWSRTKVWSTGGYYARLFFNVEGREPEGIVPAGKYESLRRHVASAIESMSGPDASPLGNKAYTPESLYREVRGIAPDLLVYLGDLRWRAVGKVGMPGLFTTGNDTGPDEANHAQHGIFILNDREARDGTELGGLSILDIAPTVMKLLDLKIPADMQGKSIP